MLRINGDEMLLAAEVVEREADGWARTHAWAAVTDAVAALPGSHTGPVLRFVGGELCEQVRRLDDACADWGDAVRSADQVLAETDRAAATATAAGRPVAR